MKLVKATYGDHFAIPVINHMAVLKHLNDNSTLRLLANQAENMRKAFGPNPCLFKGVEHHHLIWPFEFKKHLFYVLTGKRGTSIEIDGVSYEEYSKSYKLGRIAIEFIDELVKKLKLKPWKAKA